jgi:hypothetical protein
MTDLVTQEFSQWAQSQGLGPGRAEIRVEHLGIPHVPRPLPDGWQGVYCFKYQTVWLKVGKAGPKSAARWTSHHYHPGRAQSTLAFSLLRYGRFSEVDFPEVPDLRARVRSIDADGLGDWIKKNTERVNFLIRSELGPSGLDRLEKIAQNILHPIFEGNWDPAGWKTISRLIATGVNGAAE